MPKFTYTPTRACPICQEQVPIGQLDVHYVRSHPPITMARTELQNPFLDDKASDPFTPEWRRRLPAYRYRHMAGQEVQGGPGTSEPGQRGQEGCRNPLPYPGTT